VSEPQFVPFHRDWNRWSQLDCMKLWGVCPWITHRDAKGRIATWCPFDGAGVCNFDPDTGELLD